MRQITALLWKEWRELRAFLFIGLFVFLGLPLIGEYQAMLFNPRHPFQPIIVPWIFALGGVLAIFMGTAATCRDLRDDLRIFWISRAVSPVRWLLAKHAVAVAILMAVCILPLLVELAATREQDRSMREALDFLLTLNPFLLLAIYGTAALFGSLVRRLAQAAMLSIAVCLLLYCLPYVVPPLEALSLSVLMDSRAQQELGKGPVCFVVGMLAVGLATLALSVVAVRFDWRVHADRKVIYWSVGLAGLLIVVTAAFQVGANLPIQQELAVPQGRHVWTMLGQADRGVLVLSQRLPTDQPSFPGTAACTFRVDGARVELGPVIELPDVRPYMWGSFHGPGTAAFDARWPSLVYLATVGVDAASTREQWSLLTVRLDGQTPRPVQRLELDSVPYDEGDPHGRFGRPSLQIAGDHLIAACEPWASSRSAGGLALLSIEQPLQPRLVSSHPWEDAGAVDLANYDADHQPESFMCRLPTQLGLSREQRLDVVLARYWGLARLDCDTLVAPGSLAAYRLRQIDDRMAVFDRVGAYTPSLIERVLLTDYHGLAAASDLVYVQPAYWRVGNPVISVFDASRPQRLRRVGHFAVPSETGLLVHPLPDGRALIAGDKLYLVGAPRR